MVRRRVAVGGMGKIVRFALQNTLQFSDVRLSRYDSTLRGAQCEQLSSYRRCGQAET